MAKKWLVIDSHNHFFPEDVLKKLGTADGMDYVAMATGDLARIYQQGRSIENTLQVMDEAGVDISVLNQSTWSPLGLTICQALNDAYSRIARDYPERFISCAHVPLDGSPELLNELDRAVNELGLKVVSLVSSTTSITLDSEKLFPLWEKISILNMPVIIHPTTRTPLWGASSYMLNSAVAREYDVAKATVEVLNAVLTRFPDLRFLIPHHGGGVPFLKGRIMARFEPAGWKIPEEIKGTAKTPRVLKDLGLDKAYDEYFDKLYFDTAGASGWMPLTETTVKIIRTDRLCFGTDYPFEISEARDIKLFIGGIKQLKIPEAEIRNILGDNFRQFLRLS
jgi:predicted TIM-barrel fold metal-dependent hydrolase